MNAATEQSKRIRVAVVGAGEFGRNHARVYRELECAELVGVFDQNPERAAAVAAEFQTQTLQSLEKLCGRADAASVAVPTVAHAEVGCRLMEMGLDVLVEKPMAVSLAEADALLAPFGMTGVVWWRTREREIVMIFPHPRKWTSPGGKGSGK